MKLVVRNAVQQGIAVVEATAYKRMNSVLAASGMNDCTTLLS